MAESTTLSGLPETVIARVSDEELLRQNNEFRLPRDHLTSITSEIVARGSVLRHRATELEANKHASRRVWEALQRPRLWLTVAGIVLLIPLY